MYPFTHTFNNVLVFTFYVLRIRVLLLHIQTRIKGKVEFSVLLMNKFSCGAGQIEPQLFNWLESYPFFFFYGYSHTKLFKLWE